MVFRAAAYVVCTVHTVHTFIHLSQILGYAVVQLIEALRYKPEGRGFYSR